MSRGSETRKKSLPQNEGHAWPHGAHTGGTRCCYLRRGLLEISRKECEGPRAERGAEVVGVRLAWRTGLTWGRGSGGQIDRQTDRVGDKDKEETEIKDLEALLPECLVKDRFSLFLTCPRPVSL